MGTENSLIKEKYGDSFKEHLLKQYELFVGTSLDVTSKRMESNKFHLTLNSIIFGFTSYLTTLNQYVIIVLFSLVGLLTCYVWKQTVLSYKELNKAKFKVIHRLEEHLPASVFKFEEKFYLNKYHELTSLESYYPYIFMILYGALLIIVGLSSTNII